MSWGISKIHGASRQSDSVSLLRLLPSSMPIAVHKAGALCSVGIWYFFQFPFINVGTWVFIEERGSFSQSLASNSKPGSTSILHVAVPALILFKSLVLCSHGQFLAWEFCVSLIMSALSLCLF